MFIHFYNIIFKHPKNQQNYMTPVSPEDKCLVTEIINYESKELPSDVLEKILFTLIITDHANSAAVCKYWSEVSIKDPRWKLFMDALKIKPESSGLTTKGSVINKIRRLKTQIKVSIPPEKLWNKMNQIQFNSLYSKAYFASVAHMELTPIGLSSLEKSLQLAKIAKNIAIFAKVSAPFPIDTQLYSLAEECLKQKKSKVAEEVMKEMSEDSDLTTLISTSIFSNIDN